MINRMNPKMSQNRKRSSQCRALSKKLKRLPKPKSSCHKTASGHHNVELNGTLKAEKLPWCPSHKTASGHHNVESVKP